MQERTGVREDAGDAPSRPAPKLAAGSEPSYSCKGFAFCSLEARREVRLKSAHEGGKHEVLAVARWLLLVSPKAGCNAERYPEEGTIPILMYRGTKVAFGGPAA